MIKLNYSVNLQQPSKFAKNKFAKNNNVPLAWINFENVMYDPDNGILDRVLLTNKYGGRLNKNAVSYSTPEPDNAEHPKTQAIITAYGFLESTNRYEMPPLNQMMMELSSVMSDHFTAADVENVEKSTDDMYVEFMQKLEDPKVQMLLQSLGQYQVATSTYGWRRSMDNVMRAYRQKPDATFVQTRYEWFYRYNRTIKPGAQRLLLVSPKQDFSCDYSDIIETMRELGYPDGTRFDDLSTQQQEHVKVATIYHTGKGFETKVYYDVSDTYVIDGEEDKWSEEVGFDNNFTGHLNQKAMDDVTSKGIDVNGVDPREIYNREEGNPQVLNSAIVKGISNGFPEITPSTNGNPLTCFINNVQKLANYLLETKSKIVKQENRDASVKIITAFVLCFTKLKPEEVVRGIQSNIMSREAYLELRDRINDIIRLINNSMIKMENKDIMNESIPYLQSVDQMLSMMGLDLNDGVETAMEDKKYNTNSIKESFITTLNKLNEHKYYNEKYE